MYKWEGFLLGVISSTSVRSGGVKLPTSVADTVWARDGVPSHRALNLGWTMGVWAGAMLIHSMDLLMSYLFSISMTRDAAQTRLKGDIQQERSKCKSRHR